MPNTIKVREVNHPLDERKICEVTDLWHDYLLDNKDLPDPSYGAVVPCLVRRKELSGRGAERIETVLDHFHVYEQVFDDTPSDRLRSWCYIEDLLPRESDLETFKVEKRGDFYFSVIGIKDFFDDVFTEMEEDDNIYRLLCGTFFSYESGLFFVGETTFPVEDASDSQFSDSVHLYLLRFSNNGCTLLASTNRLALELALGKENKSRFLKIR